MTWQVPISQTAQVNLGEMDDAFIASGVTIATGVSAAIFGTGSGHDVLVYGTVTSAQNSAIVLGDTGEDSAQNVTIKAGGHVQAFGELASALVINAHGSTVVNQGLMASQNGSSIHMLGIGGPASTLINSGTIDAADFGVVNFASDLVLVNSGTISGDDGSYLGAEERDLITNTGSMTGDVTLFGGNDVYNGAKGRFNGDVFGGDGNDIITGGKDNDVFFGDAGNDTLTGGLGRDRFTGGSGRDFFDFNSVKESVKGANRDVILDFNRTVDDRIDLETIDAKTGVGGNQAFKFIDTAAFHDVKGELRCKNGVVQGDVNGDGKADFEIKVNLATMVAGDFFL